ncbi:DUF2637 domain-containing protein [Qaidamihabitans albus]|uniref:DUF2637 domain-containing protein n=1 Tax=Qaidamihabitans albus TaxID=2795733 RepID=UPI0018F1D998|nr:DUF2637 domain-containing protein [Qaidamihabitans albus]
MSTPDSPAERPHRVADAIRILITVILGGIGAAAGFKHTHDWAVANGQTGWLAWADAVVIEGMAVVAGFEIQRDHQHQTRTRRITFPVVVLVVAFGIQMAAQVALAPRTVAGWLLAAMPALGFLVVVKLLMRRTPPPTPAGASAPTPPSQPATTPTRQDSSPAPAAGTVLARLPATARTAITDATATAHQQGRPVTADELTERITLPDAVLPALVDELNATVNHHPLTA